MIYIKPFLLFLTIAIAVLGSVQIVYGFTSGWEGSNPYNLGSAKCVGGSEGDAECVLINGLGWECYAFQCRFVGISSGGPGSFVPTTTLPPPAPSLPAPGDPAPPPPVTVFCLSGQCADVDTTCIDSGQPSADGQYACIDGEWIDPDTGNPACSIVGGRLGIVGERSLTTQYGRTSALLVQGTQLCAKPGDDYFYRWRECSIATSSCATDAADDAICDKNDDCVFNGICYSDIDVVANAPIEATFENFATISDVWKSEKFRTEVSFDVNGNSKTEFCDPGEWQGEPNGILTGIVRNVTHVLPGAIVRVVGLPGTDTTDALGQYSINVFGGTYDLVASKPSEGYADANIKAVSIPAFETTVQDFTLLLPSEGCNDDCTRADGLCHADCQGKGLCGFASETTKTACDLTAKGIVGFGAQQIVCCTGTPYTPVKTNVVVCGDNVISNRIPVLISGIQATMVTTLFNIGECQNI